MHCRYYSILIFHRSYSPVKVLLIQSFSQALIPLVDPTSMDLEFLSLCKVECNYHQNQRTVKPVRNNDQKGNPQIDLKDKGVIDSGCSRHMTGNVSYLTDYKEIDGGYVAFGGNPIGGKITGKGTIKIGNLDFENMYFVSPMDINPINSSVDEEGGTIVVGCENDASIQKLS
ncbi:hypothetical protein Tco_0304101 [Tanacetum coccineum]